MATAVIMVSATISETDGIELVRDGRPVAVIIVPDDSYPVVDYAAQELQYHIKRASGALLPIQAESHTTPGPSPRIYLGPCNATQAARVDPSALPPAGYIIQSSQHALFLTGRDSLGQVGAREDPTWHGTLWAVYEFLETQLGVRWVWPGELGEVIPEKKTIRIGRLAQTGAPRFLSTQLIVPSLSRQATHGWADISSRDRFLQDQDKWLLRHRFASTTSLQYGHAFAHYWKQFHETHPEFFAMLPDGTRGPLPGDEEGHGATLCVSQPALWKQIIADWRDTSRPDSRKPRPFINLCENDTPGLCTCPSCRAWDAPDPRFKTSRYWAKGVIPHFRERFHGVGFGLAGSSAPWGGVVAPDDAPSLSDRYARFYLEVWNEARRDYPDAVVFGYAYANYWEAPKHTRLDEAVFISYVPPLWFPYTEEMSRRFRANWDGWRKTGARLVLRPNLMHAGHNMPVFYARRFAADFSYAASRGMIGTCFDSLLGAWAAQGPTLYAIARIHAHPEWSSDAILAEYFSAFGKAEPEVREYFSHWEDLGDTLTTEDIGRYHDDEGGGGFKDYVLIADRIFTPDIMREGRRRIEKALHAAQDDAMAHARVAYLEKGLRNAELTLDALHAFKQLKQAPSRAAEQACRDALSALMNYRAAVERDNVCDLGYMAYRETRGAGWQIPSP